MEEASSRYKDLHKTDSPDTSVFRAEDCSVRSKFERDVEVAGSNPSQWMQSSLLLRILKK